MITSNQFYFTKRIKKIKKNKVSALLKNPQQKGICMKVLIKAPKKPHSGKKKWLNYDLKINYVVLYMYIYQVLVMILKLMIIFYFEEVADVMFLD